MKKENLTPEYQLKSARKYQSKFKRVTSYIEPALFEKVKAAADGRGLSFNAFLIESLEKALNSADDLKKNPETEKSVPIFSDDELPFCT